MDNHALYSKWMGDIRDGQRSDGRISDVMPAYWRLCNTNITWPACLPFACDMLYRQYGDLRPMRDSYGAVGRFLDMIKKSNYKDGLVPYDRYGDWCVSPESPRLVHSKDPARQTDGRLISSAYYYYLCRLMQRYAARLTRVSASHRSPYGIIASDWRCEGGTIRWKVTVPPNTTAEAHLPDGTVREISSGEWEF